MVLLCERRCTGILFHHLGATLGRGIGQNGESARAVIFCGPCPRLGRLYHPITRCHGLRSVCANIIHLVQKQFALGCKVSLTVRQGVFDWPDSVSAVSVLTKDRIGQQPCINLPAALEPNKSASGKSDQQKGCQTFILPLHVGE